MTDPRLTGIHCAIITPLMDDRERVDTDGLERLIDSLLDAGITGIVVLGGTGEYTALSFAERERAIRTAVEHTNGRVPVTVGIVAPGIGDAKAMAVSAQRAGADYIMPVTPYYVHPTQDGIVRWFSRLAENINLPLILYNIPSRTSVNLKPETVLDLIETIGNIAGIKECTADLGQFSELVELTGDRISILSGEEYYVLPELLLGARGGILASSNLIPHQWVRLYEATRNGDFVAARGIYADIFPLLRAVFSEVNPGPLKAAMRHAGLPAGPVSDPLGDPSPQVMERLEAVLARLGVAGAV